MRRDDVEMRRGCWQRWEILVMGGLGFMWVRKELICVDVLQDVVVVGGGYTLAGQSRMHPQQATTALRAARRARGAGRKALTHE